MSLPQDSIDWNYVLGAPTVAAWARDPSQLPQFVEALTRRPPRAVRLRPDREELPFVSESVPWYAGGRLVANAADAPGTWLQHAAGDYYVQDAASMLPLALCDAQPGELVVDVCAAPGGKSTGLLEQLQGRGCLISNEVVSSRIPVLQLALERLGLAGHILFQLDPERLAELVGPSCDCVLVDAPCTGQSMLARGKQSWQSFSRKQIEHSAARQQRILMASAKMVRPGGRLIYSTCSFSYAENEQVVTEFLQQHPSFRPGERPELQPWRVADLPGQYRLWPQQHACAGGFAALLQRQDAEAELPPNADYLQTPGIPDRPIPGSAEMPDSDRPAGKRKRRAVARNRKGSRKAAERRTEVPQELPAWLPDSPVDRRLEWLGDYLHAFPQAAVPAWIDQCVGGTRMACRDKERWRPLFGSAMLAGRMSPGSEALELSDTDAKKFVAGESLFVNGQQPGWQIVWWRGRPLGWGKVVAGTLKNHFPKSLRQSVKPS